MAKSIGDLQADVKAASGVEQSAIALLNGLTAQIAALKSARTDAATAAAIDALAHRVETNTAALAVAVAANTPAAPAPAPVPDPAPAPAPQPAPQPGGTLPQMVALLELPLPIGAVTFDIADGVDVGDYVAPTAGFTQRCIRVRNAAVAHFFVDFRPDATGDRAEAVFWNGEVDPENQTVPSGYTRDLPSYPVTVTKDGAVIYRATVPPHVWATRWRWQSAPRPVIRNGAQVFTDKFFPHMSRAAARLDATTVIKPRPVAGVGTYTPFMGPDAARLDYKLGILLNIETGGERLELGAMTEWAADYLLNGTTSSLNALLQHAEMASSEWPFFLSDRSTGAALNFKQDLARYRTYIDGGSYDVYYRAAFTNRSNGWEFHEADSHFQMHPYVAYALTEDAYFLEGIQFIQAYGVGNKGCMYYREGSPDPSSSQGVFGYGGLLIAGKGDGSGGIAGQFTVCSGITEIRTVGNGIRNLAMAYKTAPAAPPSWLLGKPYYAAQSSDYSTVTNKLWTTNPAPTHAVFRQLSFDPYFQAFEQAYALMGMAIADLVGMPTGAAPSWLAHLTFYFGMFDAITNGTSGWNNQTPQPHDLRRDGSENPFVKMDDHKSWGTYYKAVEPFLKTGATFPNAPSPGNQQAGSMGNCSMMVGACGMALSRGVPAAANAKAWLDQFIDFNYPNNDDASMGNSFEMKCAFDGK